MMSVAKKLREAFPVLGSLDSHDLGRLLEGASPLEAPAGTVMFESSSPCRVFPMLFEGTIRVVKAAENGRELLLYRVAPGESCILTSSCLLGNSAYSARGVAETDLSGLVISKPIFTRLVEQHPPFRDYIFGLFATRLSDLMLLVEEVAFRRLDQRLAGILLAKGMPVVNVTHQSLADELGSAREMVSRLLKSFEEQGWVTLGRQQITVANPVALKSLAQV